MVQKDRLRCRSFLFSVQCYSDAHIEALDTLAVEARYLIFKFDPVTRYLEGYVVFHNARWIDSIRKKLMPSSITVCDGLITSQDYVNYFKLFGFFAEFGQVPCGRGVRTDMMNLL